MRIKKRLTVQQKPPRVQTDQKRWASDSLQKLCRSGKPRCVICRAVQQKRLNAERVCGGAGLPQHTGRLVKRLRKASVEQLRSGVQQQARNLDPGAECRAGFIVGSRAPRRPRGKCGGSQRLPAAKRYSRGSFLKMRLSIRSGFLISWRFLFPLRHRAQIRRTGRKRVKVLVSAPEINLI